MARILETKACTACAMAKRRCGKQAPHCLRCRTRGIECTYPPTKPSNFVLYKEHEPLSIKPASSGCNALQLSTYSPGLPNRGEAGDARLSLGIDISGYSRSILDNQLPSDWFASLDTWRIRFPPTDQSSMSITDLKRYVMKIHQWLTQWVEKGSNPFIHAHLYRNHLPRCVQDAYAALSCYLHMTAFNKQIVFKIIEDQAKELLAVYNNPSTNTLHERISPDSPCLDSLEHIARVHALLIYQIIGLFDGDIRLRYLSETYIPVLRRWLQEMVEHVASLGNSIVSPTPEETAVSSISSYITQSENVLWHSWILAESVRRTWVVGNSMQWIFNALQKGFGVPCQGGMMVTTRQDVWEAPTAMAWEKLCTEVHVGLMQMADVDRLFTEVKPEEVNEFTKVVLEVVFGREKMERWGVQIDD
jgi:hypothetical protein